jgi:hypothetical protein
MLLPFTLKLLLLDQILGAQVRPPPVRCGSDVDLGQAVHELLSATEDGRRRGQAAVGFCDGMCPSLSPVLDWFTCALRSHEQLKTGRPGQKESVPYANRLAVGHQALSKKISIPIRARLSELTLGRDEID